MKDKRFLELVNVYLDGEISDAETAELEREIRSSAGRMEQYRRYCRMQKACLQLAQMHREATPVSHDNIIRLPEAKRSWVLGQWWRGGVYGGTAAIAATVILIIAMSGPGQDPESSASGIANSTTGMHVVQIPVGEFARKATTETRLASLTDRWSALTHLKSANPTPALAAAPTPEFNQATTLASWHATSLFPESGPLEFRYQTDPISGAKVLHGQPHPSDGEVEFATFQFAR